MSAQKDSVAMLMDGEHVDHHDVDKAPERGRNASGDKGFNIKIAKVKQMHAAVIAHRHDAREKALHIGEVLDGIKGKLKHKEWLPWLAANLPEITKRTAQNYVRVGKNRYRLKNETGAFLDENYTTALGRLSREKKADPAPDEIPAKGTAERIRKRNVLRDLGAAFIAGLEHEDSEILELLATRLPDWRKGLLEVTRREIAEAATGAKAEETHQLLA